MIKVKIIFYLYALVLQLGWLDVRLLGHDGGLGEVLSLWGPTCIGENVS